MFTTLLESRATRTRRTGSTVASMLFHGGLIAAAIAVTIPGDVDATPRPPEPDPKVIYLPVRPQHVDPIDRIPTQSTVQQASPQIPVTLNIVPPTITPNELPPIDVGPVIPPDQIRVGAGGLTSPTATGPSSLFVGDGPVDVAAVDRIPRMLGTPPTPRYPAALRESGISGRVTVRFVVDTTGRAEVDGMQVIETSHQLFSESVRNALGTFRFSAGEIGGRKVRTMVQLPFTFALR
jgi:protein TonB